jgi:[protein-PII] uridylyltransferase
MRDYYRHSRTIFTVVDAVLRDLADGEDLAPLWRRRRSLRRDVFTLPLRKDRLRRDPLFPFFEQKRTGLPMDRRLRKRLEESLESELRGASFTRRMRRRFVELFDDARHLALVLRTMQETGFLARIAPELGRLVCLKRYDLYHYYTADEHSFRAVENLETLARWPRGTLAPLARLYSEVPDKRLLLLAALFHDVGKIEGHGHAAKGARLVRRILPRLGLTPEEVDFVAFLVDKHLLMSHFSQRRDPTEVGTLERFCAQVGSRTRLKALCLLSYADLKATSPVVWTRWKQTLLWNFYLAASQFMARKEKQPEAVYRARKRLILRAFPAGPERDRARAHLDLLPGRYLLTMKPAQVKRQMAMLEELDGRAVRIDLRRRGHTVEATFCTLDRPFVLAWLCGILAVNDFNILNAFAFTRSDGRVIDLFLVEDLSPEAEELRERRDRMERMLEGILEGRLDIDELYRTHVRRWKRRRAGGIPAPPRVEFDNDLSREFTVVDVFAKDEPGLLYLITRTLSELGLTIHRARISTEADRAIDAFYVKDRLGRKVVGASRLQKIRDTLVRTLREGPPE